MTARRLEIDSPELSSQLSLICDRVTVIGEPSILDNLEISWVYFISEERPTIAAVSRRLV